MTYDDAAATGLCPNIVSYTKANTTRSPSRSSRENAARGSSGQSGVVGLGLLTMLSIIASLLL